MSETARRVTVACVSDTAEVIRINAKDILPKLKERSVKEFIRYARSKITLTEEIIKNYISFQIELFTRVKNDNLFRISSRNIKHFSDQPTHIAVQISKTSMMSRNSTMGYNSGTVSKMPSLTAIPRLEYTQGNYKILNQYRKEEIISIK
jgi:hypothetical protein